MISPKSVERFNFAVASGLIAGEGLMGIVNAALTIFGIDSDSLMGNSTRIANALLGIA